MTWQGASSVLTGCSFSKVYEPARYMSIGAAIAQLLEVEEGRKEGAYSGDTLCVGIARLGAESQSIVAGSMAELAGVDFGPPLHCLIIAGETHVVEQEMLAQFRTRPVANDAD